MDFARTDVRIHICLSNDRWRSSDGFCDVQFATRSSMFYPFETQSDVSLRNMWCYKCQCRVSNNMDYDDINRLARQFSAKSYMLLFCTTFSCAFLNGFKSLALWHSCSFKACRVTWTYHNADDLFLIRN